MTKVQSRFQNVKSVLAVISSRSMAFDLSALRNFITHAYPGAAVFFISTSGDPIGVAGPNQVSLVIDFTEPGARQSLFFAARLRRRAEFVVGRATGRVFFGRKSYDRLYEEPKREIQNAELSFDYMDREREIQRKVLELAGISIVKQGGVTPDLSKDIAQAQRF